MSKVAGKPRGRISAYAYYVQAARDAERKANPDKPIVFAEFSRKCAANWKILTAEQKKPFEKSSEADKIRFENEMKNYTPPPGTSKSPKRKGKDPEAPKRPLSGFIIFSNEARPLIRAKNPEMRITDIAKKLGELWSVMTPEDKAKFQKQAAKNKAEYDINLRAYKNGKKSKVEEQEVPELEQDTDETDTDIDN